MNRTRPDITLVNGSESERQLEETLLALFDRYGLEKWLYTEQVNLEDGAIPHSHPVLTLTPKTQRTDYGADPERLLAVYIHEQMHWFLMLEDPARDRERLHAELRDRYPNLPVGFPDGCRSEFSNYVHIMVNFLEYRGLRELLGDDRARAVITQHPGYRAIYAVVLRDYADLEHLFTDCNLTLPGRPPLEKRFRTPRPKGQP